MTGKVKRECTLLVVSHDLRELADVVDCAWHMHTGGKLSSAPWPPLPDSQETAAFQS